MGIYRQIMSAEELDSALKMIDAPDHDLEDRIWRWVNENKLNPSAPGWQYDIVDAPAYTTSLDAAYSLIPVVDGSPMDFVLEHVNGGITIGARVGHNDPDLTNWGYNDAVALTRAALRAHIMFEGRK